MNISGSLNKNPGVGHPLALTKQFYQVDASLGKPNSFQRQGHFHHRISIRKDKLVRAADVGKLLGGGEADVHIKGNLSQTLKEPGKYHELPLHMRIVCSADAIEQAEKISFTTRKSDSAIAEIESLRYGQDGRGGHSLPFANMSN